MRTYRGTHNAEGDCVIYVNDKVLPLNPSLKVCNHSPAGFNWGYRGSGPAQTALAILMDHYRDNDLAERLHQLFKDEVVAYWPFEGWTITNDEIDDICSKWKEDDGEN
jgi:hypothetical protein